VTQLCITVYNCAGNRTALIIFPFGHLSSSGFLGTQCSGRNPCVSLQMQRPPDVCVCISIQMDLNQHCCLFMRMWQVMSPVSQSISLFHNLVMDNILGPHLLQRRYFGHREIIRQEIKAWKPTSNPKGGSEEDKGNAEFPNSMSYTTRPVPYVLGRG